MNDKKEISNKHRLNLLDEMTDRREICCVIKQTLVLEHCTIKNSNDILKKNLNHNVIMMINVSFAEHRTNCEYK